MRSYRCFRCGRELSNEVSVQAGIGPICRGKVRAEEKAEERQRKANLMCHQGFVCMAPDHASTTLARFVHRFECIARAIGEPCNALLSEVQSIAADARDALGLDRPEVKLPEVQVPMFGPQTIGVLGLPPEKGPLGVSYKMPYDHDEQFRHIQLRCEKLCPFGLDCRDPRRAEQDVWRLLSIMRYQIEPMLATEEHCGWSWDRLLYQALWNTLECLGLEEDARDIQQIVEREASRPVALRMFEDE